MRILLTMTGPPGTGSGTVAEAVLDELGRQGHEAFLFYPDRPDSSSGPPDDPRHRVWRFPIQGGGVRLESFPKMIPDPHPREGDGSPTCRELSAEELHLYLEAGKDALAAVVEEVRPDVLECHHLWSLTWAAAELGLPYLAVAHHSDQMGYRYDRRMRPFADRAAREAAFVLAISEHVEEEVLELYPVEAARVEVLTPGYDAETFRPLDVSRADALEGAGLAPSYPEDLPLLTFSGKISHTKGVDLLLRANRRLQQERPTRLVVAGTGNVERTFSPDELRGADRTRVDFPGHLDHPTLARLHSAAHASVVPSREEGFGVAALEAMGCGCPVVANRVGGLPEFVVGELVEPENVDRLADALVRAVRRTAAERRALGREVHRAARAFSWPRLVERRLELYLRMTHPPGFHRGAGRGGEAGTALARCSATARPNGPETD